MSTLPLNIQMGALPPNVRWTPQQLADAIAARLSITTQQALSLFVSGSTEPSSNVGPWLKNGTEWWVWSDSDGTYVPISVPAASLGYFVGYATPDPNVYRFWIQLNILGSPLALKTYYSGSWVDVYASQFATIDAVIAALGTMAQQNATAVAITGGSGDFTTGLKGSGTTTNDNAPSGYIGEYVSSTLPVASGTALTAGAAKTVTSIALTAGDWDVSGVVFIEAVGASNLNGSGPLTYASISEATNTLAGPDSGGDNGIQTLNANGYDYALTTPVRRISLAAPATIYLVVMVPVISGTANGAGTIRARRVR